MRECRSSSSYPAPRRFTNLCSSLTGCPGLYRAYHSQPEMLMQAHPKTTFGLIDVQIHPNADIGGSVHAGTTLERQQPFAIWPGRSRRPRRAACAGGTSMSGPVTAPPARPVPGVPGRAGSGGCRCEQALIPGTASGIIPGSGGEDRAGWRFPGDYGDGEIPSDHGRRRPSR